MAKLYQSASMVSDFQKATFSFWILIPSSSQALAAVGQAPNGAAGNVPNDIYFGGIELLAIATPYVSGGNLRRYTFISLIRGDKYVSKSYDLTAFGLGTYSAGHNDPNQWGLWAHFSAPNSVHGIFNPPQVTDYVCDYDAGANGLLLDGSGGVYPRCGHFAYLSPVAFGVWHHVMISLDMSSPDSFSLPLTQSSGDKALVVANVSRTKRIEVYFDKVRRSGMYIAPCDTFRYFDEPDSHGHRLVDPQSFEFSASLAGQQISIPTFVDDSGDGTGSPVTYNPAVNYAEFQAWFGQYIDPAVHIAKFIDSSGRPVDPATPQAFFGRPQYRFRRNKRLGLRFGNNEGSAGAMVSVGSIADFGPGPP